MDIRILAVLSAILTVFQAVPLAFSLIHGDNFWPIFFSILVSAIIAVGGLTFTIRANPTLRPQDGFLVATFGWILAIILGAMPYLFSGSLHWIDAIFESTAGFTTTGSSVLTHPESWPQSLLLWRSMTQWLGGMGMLLLTIAILPFLGVGGMQLMKAEVPGPSKERLTPRLATTARVLWGFYVGFTVVLVVLYIFSGMSYFNALNHAFTTMATGGFSTRSESLAAFSPMAQWWCILFMVLAGTNFLLHYRLVLRRDWKVFHDPEWQLYIGIIITVGLIISAKLFYGSELHIETALRQSFFQTVSIMTTTGYVNVDWTVWPAFLQLLLILLMLIGGMSGSTGGGVKVIRIAVLIKLLSAVTSRLLQPNRIVVLKLGSKTVSQEVSEGCVGMVAVALILTIITGLALNIMGMDMVSAMSAALSCVSNVGPGLGTVGPIDNFALVPDAGKLLLSFDMVAGRLEIFTVLMLFSSKFWAS
ncbi:MAG: TrkH family potassium uptake protein [Magnetococcales bacterium]|nr:TrkH family potassium uptake protein [Magnetococcales bacterium]